MPSTANEIKILIDDTLSRSPVKELLQIQNENPRSDLLLSCLYGPIFRPARFSTVFRRNAADREINNIADAMSFSVINPDHV